MLAIVATALGCEGGVREIGNARLLVPRTDGRGFAAVSGSALRYYDESGNVVGDPVPLGRRFSAAAIAPSGAIVGVEEHTCAQVSIMDAAGVETATASASAGECGVEEVEIAAMEDNVLVQCRVDNCNPDGGFDDLESLVFSYAGDMVGELPTDFIVSAPFDLSAADDHAIGAAFGSGFARYASSGERMLGSSVERANYAAWRLGGYAVAGGDSFCALDTDGAVEGCRDYPWLADQERSIHGLADDGAGQLALLVAKPRWSCSDDCDVGLLLVDRRGVPIAPEIALGDLRVDYEARSLLWAGRGWVALVGDELLFVYGRPSIPQPL